MGIRGKGKNTGVDKVGEFSFNRFNRLMTLVEYIGYNNVIVQFDNNYKIKTCYHHFKNGSVANPYDRSVYGVGYLGEGIHEAKPKGKETQQYQIWSGMLYRCYDKKYHEKHPSYKDCFVCEEWHNFQNFAKWYDENFYQIENEIMNLDKDILVKGNKIYSPETCVFVPQFINALFLTCKGNRNDLPIGVSFHKKNNNYRVRCSDGINFDNHIGVFVTVEEAFNAYKTFKENYIKEVAEKYKDQIPEKLYQAMISYEVEITD